MKIAVFPGSFDPITNGHADIIERGIPLFDKIYVAIGRNIQKNYMFSLEQRKGWVKEVFKDKPTIEVVEYEGLTIDFCRKIGASHILRGLRTSADFDFERGIAQVNKRMAPELETVFIVSNPNMLAISSSIVRDVIRNGGDASSLVPFKL